jgi:hypothetical protein
LATTDNQKVNEVVVAIGYGVEQLLELIERLARGGSDARQDRRQHLG